MSDLPVRGSRLPGLWALAACALPIAVPASAAGPPAVDAGRGEALYATCAACHGASGMGQPDGPAPVLAAQHASVLSRQLADYRDGARVFVMDCAGCHGATGQGDAERGIPRLAGQHHGYLRRQVQDAVEGRRPRLQGSHGARSVSLTAAEVDGLSDYLSRDVRRAAPAPVPAPAR